MSDRWDEIRRRCTDERHPLVHSQAVAEGGVMRLCRCGTRAVLWLYTATPGYDVARKTFAKVEPRSFDETREGA